MGYQSLQACVADLERTGRLIRIEQEVDAHLEAACIARRVFQAAGPAVFFARVKNCAFPMVGNMFGTMERARYIFRDTLEAVGRLVDLRLNPTEVLRRPWRFLSLPRTAWHLLPQDVADGPVMACRTTVSALPRLQSWPDDGGPFITLPLVYTEDPKRPGPWRSNLGMYRIQLTGNQYQTDAEVGMHYQIHRGIGIHHAAAVAKGEKLPVTVHVGGPPALTLAAIMPLPEGMPEIAFAGALGDQRTRLSDGVLVDTDFVLKGFVDPTRRLPEGPFGDHLGYYSLAHDFPVMTVASVHHRRDAIWPFTTVGRPPQEDTMFGALIHELTGPLIPAVLPGVKAVHAVDAAGVHPLLLAIGSERYTPYEKRTSPREILTQANAILGQGQLSLAKYLLIVAGDDNPNLSINDIPAFLHHLLSRIDFRRDLHFQTCTTIDTLDYSSGTMHMGSKLVMAAVGAPRRALSNEVPNLPASLRNPRLVMPGVLAVEGDPIVDHVPTDPRWEGTPLWVVVDDSAFTAATLSNFLWVTFTRSNPAADVHGIDAFIEQKHWGCRGPLVIDARRKPHHAPPLEEDPAVMHRVDALAAPGGPLHGIL
ncbi:MAG TPA: UbiD family decarboxylase [Candidatus Xenobia bacterium]